MSQEFGRGLNSFVRLRMFVVYTLLSRDGTLRRTSTFFMLQANFVENKLKVLKMICNDFLVVRVNCWSYVFNIIQSIRILRNIKDKKIAEKSV